MNSTLPHESTSPNRLRLWPGVVLVTLQWLAWAVVPQVVPDAGMVSLLGGLGGGLLVLIWWLFFSRALWSERLGAVALIVVALLATKRIVHPSIANGAMGMLLFVYATPLLSLALVVWAALSQRLAAGPRRVSLVAAIALACGVMMLLRTGGMTGGGRSDLHWRWTETPEQQLLAQSGKREPTAREASQSKTTPPPATEPAPAPAPVSARPTDAETASRLSAPAPTGTRATWPGFRGPERDGVVRGVRIATDWTRSPPKEMWRRPVGPGWSSFAVDGNLVYTQEQRGDDEIVSCYDLTTGAPVWNHADPARFWESNGGAGPRGTPTLSNGRVYALGATGILNALDARSGVAAWSRNAASDTGKKIPGWGFSSSPVAHDDLVIVATAGVLAAYDATTGVPRWIGPKGGWGYSSPHLSTLHGIPQIVLLHGAGAVGVAPADGKMLWEHPWKSDGIVQPTVTADGDVLIGSGSGLGGKVGLRRVAVARNADGWTTDERWTSLGLKPYFNDFVVHAGHAFGVDGTTLACVDLATGDRKWKGGRYGNGQMILLADQDVLVVVSEQGQIALVRALPDKFTELARVPAVEGKTWNHPVLVGDVLLVRNDREMVAFRLAREDS